MTDVRVTNPSGRNCLPNVDNFVRLFDYGNFYLIFLLLSGPLKYFISYQKVCPENMENLVLGAILDICENQRVSFIIQSNSNHLDW